MKTIRLVLMVFILFSIFGCTKEEAVIPETNKQEIESSKTVISEPKEKKPEEEQIKKPGPPKESTTTEEPKKEPIEETKPIEPTIIEKPNEENEEKLIIFHNNRGPMCIAQLDFLDEIRLKHHSLIIEEHLTYEAGTTEVMYGLMSQYGKSQGVSSNFEYLPITFINKHAYSGFNEDVREKLEQDIKEICK